MLFDKITKTGDDDTLIHDNALESNLSFQIKDTHNLYEELKESNNQYAIITLTVGNSTKKFNNIISCIC